MADDVGGSHDRPEVGSVAVMVIRVWIEEGGDFRARLTETLSLNGGDERVAVISEPSRVLAHVQRWLESFLEPRHS